MKNTSTYILCIILCLLVFIPLRTSAFWFFTPKRTLTSGLVGWWTFDGKDMTPNVRDASGNGNHGNLVGQTSTTTVPGRLGQALKFDGVNDTVNAGNISGADGIGAISMGGWVKITTGSSGNPSIITKDWYGTQDQYQLYANLTFGRWTIVLFNEAVQSGIVESGNSTVKYDTWQHVITTYDGSYVRLYLDGVEVGTPAALTGNVRDLSAPVCLGNTADSGTTCNYAGTFWHNGALDDVRLYNRALSTSEVKQLYAQGAGAKQNITSTKSLTSDLIGWWTFDGKDVVNGRVNDISGGGNHGNTSGISSSTFYTAGKIGQGFKFDGADDKVNISGSTVHNTYQTVAMWVKMTDTSADQTVAYVSHQCSANNLIAYDYQSSNSGRFVFTTCTSGPDLSAPTGDNTIKQNEWHHVVGTISENGANMEVKIYLNGVYVSTATTLLTNIRWWQASGSVIGANVGSTGYSNAVIDDVRLYSRALSATEIKQLYSQAAGSKQNVTTTKSYLSSNLVAWWTFDGKDVVNGRVNDVSGNGNHGNPSGISTSTFYTVGKIGQALKFNGSNYVNAGDIAGADGIPTITIAAWVKFASPTGAAMNILYKGQSGFDAWQLGRSGFGNYFFSVSNTVPTVGGALSDSTYEDTDWHHVVGVYDGANVYVYVDGVSADSSANPLTGNIRDRVEPICVGGGYGGGCLGSLNGKLDDVRIYNRALSATEIKQLYNQGK